MKFSKDLQQMLRDWRPTVPSDLASLAVDRARPSQQVVGQVLHRLKLDDRLSGEKLCNAWIDAVGELSRHAIPCEFRHKILRVTVTNSVLLSELRVYRKALILQRLREKFGADKIRDIVFHYSR